MIETQGDLAALCERVAAAPRVALDTEFHNERSYAARLMVVQLALGEGIVLVDPLRVPDLQPLAEALAQTTVVGHALHGDLKIFADRFGQLPKAVFDTQLAAAFCGFGMSISLGDLVARLLDLRLRKGQTTSDWSRRPLSAPQIEYLVDDVAHLFALADRLHERLAARGRLGWYEDEAAPLCELARYQPDPERLYLRIPGAARMNRRELGILRELAQMRDALARERDIPLKYVIPDDAMVALVGLRPRSVAEFAQLRRIDAGTRKAFGERIVAAVATGLALPDEALPRKPARPPGTERDALASLLAVQIGAIAAEADLPAGLLATRSALERVARELPQTPEAIARTLEVDGWRASLVAAPLHALLQGQVALGVRGAMNGTAHIAAVPTGGESES